ncbi:hypothetical protein Emag_004070 [Eimeria magna]
MAAASAAGAAPAAAQQPTVLASFEAAYTPDAVEAWGQHAAWCCYHTSKAGGGVAGAAAAAAAAEEEQAAGAAEAAIESHAADTLQDIFCVAMYEYKEPTRTRTGGLSFYTVQQQQQQQQQKQQQQQQQQQQTGELAVQLSLLHEAKSFGCLDLRWLCPPGGGCCCSGPPLSEQRDFESMLVVVGSDCALHAFRVSVHHRDDVSSSSSSSSMLRCSSIADVPLLLAPGQDHIGLGLDALFGTSQCIAATCSDGSVAVVSDLEFLSARWKAHEAEAWSVAISPSPNGKVIATGADDCKLRLWDIRANCRRPAADQPITKNSSSSSSNSSSSSSSDSDSDTNDHSSSRSSSSSSSRRDRPRLHAENARVHSMGVTALSFAPHAESLLWTGSYDGFIRCFDLRALRGPLYELGASGGLWRLRWALGEAFQIRGPHTVGSGKGGPLLLAACCHGGCEVWAAPEAEGDTSAQPLQRVLQLQPHKSMAYGITRLCCSSQQQQQQQRQQQQQQQQQKKKPKRVSVCRLMEGPQGDIPGGPFWSWRRRGAPLRGLYKGPAAAWGPPSRAGGGGGPRCGDSTRGPLQLGGPLSPLHGHRRPFVGGPLLLQLQQEGAAKEEGPSSTIDAASWI